MTTHRRTQADAPTTSRVRRGRPVAGRRDRRPVGSPQAPRAGLYDPRFEHDACGVALVADLQGRRSHTLVRQAISALEHLAHRGATGSEEDSGDGAGILIQVPHDFYADVVDFDLPARGPLRHRHRLPVPRPGRGRRRPGPPSTSWPARRGSRSSAGATVPIDDATLGSIAEAAMPSMHQLFVAPAAGHRADR